MRGDKRIRLLSGLAAAALITLALASSSWAAESFQFSPPPFAYINQRGIDAQQDTSVDYVGMEIGKTKFHAANFGFNRAAKHWDRGGMTFGFNYMLITGSGKESGTDVSFFGIGLAPNYNFVFDLFGDEEDNFSVPIYFGPHLNYNNINGSFKVGSTNASIGVLYFSYGAQYGIQAGINLGPLKLVPYLDFSKEMGGSVITTISPCYGGSCSTTTTIEAQPVAMSPGVDLMIRPWGMSVGAMTQALKKPNSKDETKTTVIHLRFKKKFQSICGL